MLVLSRRVGESVVIGDHVVVTVLDVRGDVVRIGVEAPRSVAVHREEVLREVEETNRASAAPSDATAAALQEAARRRAQTGSNESPPAR